MNYENITLRSEELALLNTWIFYMQKAWVWILALHGLPNPLAPLGMPPQNIIICDGVHPARFEVPRKDSAGRIVKNKAEN